MTNSTKQPLFDVTGYELSTLYAYNNMIVRKCYTPETVDSLGTLLNLYRIANTYPTKLYLPNFFRFVNEGEYTLFDVDTIVQEGNKWILDVKDKSMEDIFDTVKSFIHDPHRTSDVWGLGYDNKPMVILPLFGNPHQ